MSDTPAIPSTALDAEGNAPRRGPAGPPTPAATVVALRDGPDGTEVLLLRRQRGGAFSGMWVFPGGKVEAGDAETAGIGAPDGIALGALGPEQEIAVAREAAVREAMEEAQLVLAADALHVHSYWLPPAEAPRRFSTWFFVAPAGSAGDIVVDRTEVHEHRWVTPAAAMEERAAGTLALAPPTWVTLWQIGQHPDVASVMAEAAARSPLRFETRVWGGDDGTALVWEGDAGYDDGDLGRVGGRRRLWVADDRPWRLELASATGADG
jgi:8-oxo-dGTP pyrophosphatase MutT (NUDIX family)